MRALSRFPQRPSGKTTRTTSSSRKKPPITALRSTARSIDLVGSIVAGWLTARGGQAFRTGAAFRAGAIAATLVGSFAGTAVAQQTANPLRDLAPTTGAAHARPNWSTSRDANLPATLELAAPGVQPASANQAISSSVVPRSTTSDLGQDSDFAANGSRLDWRPRMSAAERVKRQVAQRQNVDAEASSAPSNDPFRDPFGDAKAVRTVADWSEANGLRGQASPAVDRSGERRGAVVHAQAQTPEKSVLVARNNADEFPAPPALVEEEPVAPLVPSRQQFAQGAPVPGTTDEGDAAPLPAPGDRDEMVSPSEETVEDHLRRCATAAEFARNAQLSRISLDLTPPYAPSLMRTESEPKEDPAVALAEEPARSWTNRGGSVLAEGRLVGYENGFVKIETGNGVQQIRQRDLSEEDLYYLGRTWRIPAECVLRDETLLARSFEPTTFTWKASALCHKPLYFEETQLERYGHTAGPIAQPIISGAHFFVNIATLPYNMGVAPPNECQYVLGYYRPGSCAPWMIEPIPISLRGAALQAGAVVGGVAILP